MTEQEMRLHRCCFTGHRPEKLFLVDEEIIKELEREIKAAIEKDIQLLFREWQEVSIFGLPRLS